MDYIEIGSSPCDEDCAQLGSDNYYNKAQKECKAFIKQLRRVFGDEPAGARLRIKSNEHDFGTYYEVVCQYDDSDNNEAFAYAINCENNTPQKWDEEALKELKGGE